jgi:hypothetical protein
MCSVHIYVSLYTYLFLGAGPNPSVWIPGPVGSEIKKYCALLLDGMHIGWHVRQPLVRVRIFYLSTTYLLL